MIKSKPTILVAINSLVCARYLAYSNHLGFMFNLGRRYTKYNFVIFNPERMSIDRMRNQAAEAALQIEAKYLLFLDDDVLVPQKDALDKLIKADGDIVAGDVCIRGYPFNHMLFRYGKKGKKVDKSSLLPLANLPKQRGVIDVDAVGFSFCLIKTSLLRKIHTPYFVTGLTNTEDIYFCLKARDQFPETTIKADTSVICDHILWDETIGSRNKAAFKKYYEALNPELKAQKTHDDRGKGYRLMIEGLF